MPGRTRVAAVVISALLFAVGSCAREGAGAGAAETGAPVPRDATIAAAQQAPASCTWTEIYRRTLHIEGLGDAFIGTTRAAAGRDGILLVGMPTFVWTAPDEDGQPVPIINAFMGVVLRPDGTVQPVPVPRDMSRAAELRVVTVDNGDWLVLWAEFDSIRPGVRYWTGPVLWEARLNGLEWQYVREVPLPESSRVLSASRVLAHQYLDTTYWLWTTAEHEHINPAELLVLRKSAGAWTSFSLPIGSVGAMELLPDVPGQPPAVLAAIARFGPPPNDGGQMFVEQVIEPGAPARALVLTRNQRPVVQFGVVRSTRGTHVTWIEWDRTGARSMVLPRHGRLITGETELGVRAAEVRGVLLDDATPIWFVLEGMAMGQSVMRLFAERFGPHRFELFAELAYDAPYHFVVHEIADDILLIGWEQAPTSVVTTLVGGRIRCAG